MSRFRVWVLAIVVALFFLHSSLLTAKQPVQKAKNTITLPASQRVDPLRFSPPLKFHVEDVIDRTGNSPPNLVLERDGGIFLSAEPREILRQRVTDSLRSAGLLASDAASADYLLTIYLSQFGHDRGIGKQFFFKVDLNVLIRNARTGEAEQVTALGTSLTGRKKYVAANIENALVKALRGFLRGASFGEAVRRLEQSAQAREAALAAAAAERAAAEAAARAKEVPAKESPAEPKPPPEEESGTVLVSSTLSGAEVYVDGAFVGNTPARIKLSPGKHALRVAMAGQDDWVRQLSVLPGSELKISATHNPKPPPEASAPDPNALSKEEILNLLTNYVPSTRIAALVREHGITFTPSAADVEEIAQAGGNNDLVEALRKVAPGKP